MRNSRIVFGAGLLFLLTGLWLAWPGAAVAQGTTTVELPLKQGWNLVSLPLVPESSDPAQIFAPIAGSTTQVWTYINSPAGGDWKGFGAGTPHDLTEMCSSSRGMPRCLTRRCRGRRASACVATSRPSPSPGAFS